jgi:hypothetical protein
MKTWVFAAATALVTAVPAFGVCSDVGSVCAEFDRSRAVFFATVTHLTPDEDDRKPGVRRPRSVTFQIIEAFKGVTAGELTLAFQPTVSGDRPFSTGEAVLVYAARTNAEGLWFAACSRTRRITADDPELVALRQLMARAPGGALEGSLEIPEASRPPSLPPTTDLSNLQLTADSLDGQPTLSISTLPGGRFMFPWLPPGRYRIRFESDPYVPVVRDIVIGARNRCLDLEPISVRPR